MIAKARQYQLFAIFNQNLKKMDRAKFRGYLTRHYKFVLIVNAVLMFYLIAFLVNPFTEFLRFQSLYDLLVQLSGIVLFCSITIEGSINITNYLNKKLPWDNRPWLRVLVQLMAQFALAAIWISILRFFMAFLFYQVNLFEVFQSPDFTAADKLNFWRYTFASILLSLLVSFAIAARNFRITTAELKLNAAKLSQIAMQAELQSLKLQLDPHFMFNNFSTLSALIAEDKTLAQSFIDHLSKVYRYMIVKIHSDTVELQKEIKFIQSYVYLIKIRHGDNVMVSIDIPEHFMNRKIPPITLQLLIENAIKHNIASAAQPLEISIAMKDENLVVRNTLQKLSNPAPVSSKIGLENIKARYRIVSGLEPVIEEANGVFSVALPLLD